MSNILLPLSLSVLVLPGYDVCDGCSAAASIGPMSNPTPPPVGVTIEIDYAITFEDGGICLIEGPDCLARIPCYWEFDIEIDVTGALPGTMQHAQSLTYSTGASFRSALQIQTDPYNYVTVGDLELDCGTTATFTSLIRSINPQGPVYATRTMVGQCMACEELPAAG